MSLRRSCLSTVDCHHCPPPPVGRLSHMPATASRTPPSPPPHCCRCHPCPRCLCRPCRRSSRRCRRQGSALVLDAPSSPSPPNRPQGQEYAWRGGGLTLTICNKGEKEGGAGEARRRQQCCGGSGGDVVTKRGRFSSRWNA